MSVEVTVGTEEFTLPEDGEDFDWGTSVTSFFQAISDQLANVTLIGFRTSVKASPHSAASDGIADARPGFASADAATTIAGGIVSIPPGTYRFASNFTGSTDVFYHFEPGAILKPDDGITVALHIIAGPYKIFDPGNSTCIPYGVKSLLPEWWGAIGRGLSDAITAGNKLAIDKAIAVAKITGETSTTSEIFFGGFEYYTTTHTLPFERSISLIGPERRSATIRQDGSAIAAGDPLLKTGSTNHTGPSIKNLILIGHTSGGHVLHIRQCQDHLVENVQLTTGAPTSYALLRINEQCIRGSYRDIRLHLPQSGGAHHGVWIGDAADGSNPLTTNHRFYNLSSYSIAAGRAFPNGNAVFCDNAGGVTFTDCKLDDLACAAANVRVAGGRNIQFIRFGCEQRPEVVLTVADFHITNAVLITLEQTVAGNVAQQPAFLKAETVQNLTWKDSLLRGQYIADQNCRGMGFENCAFESFSTSGLGIAFPLTIYDARCTAVSSLEQITADFTAGPARQVPVLFGTGSPEGAVVSQVGVLFVRTDGAAQAKLFVKATGSGATGWELV